MSTEKTLEATPVADEPARGNMYDTVPYPSHPFPQSHPDRLATVGRLFQIDVPDIQSARVLEIGCASAGNLIPMAEQLPDAWFLGIDLSERQLNEGNTKIERLGLKNIELMHCDISNATNALDEFDFIICHGVYSWVPSDVQDAILAVCRDHLSPNGIAYVSYNAYPGWHFRGLVRDMMYYHDDDSKDPQHRAQQARALLKFLSDSVSAESSAYGMMLKSELELLSRQTDGYLLHEHLEANNHPCYFHEFMKRAHGMELQYVGDSAVSSMWIGNFPKEVAETLQRIAPDIIQREQYTDFVRNRFFRQTLLCHANVKIDRNLGSQSLEGMYLSGRFLPADGQANVELKPSASVTFQEPVSGRKLTTTDPLTKATLVHLANAWPGSVKFSDLFETARLSMGANQIEDAARVEASRNELATQLLQLFVSGLIDAKANEDRFVTTVGDKPSVSPLVRDQATRGDRLTNRRHELVIVDDFIRHICQAVDGSKTREELIAYATELVDQGTLVIHRKDKADDTRLADLLSQAVDQALQKMAKQALLVE